MTARSMMYIIKFDCTFQDCEFVKNILNLEYIKKILIYDNYLILDLKTPKYMTFIKKLFLNAIDIEIYNKQQLTTNLDKPMEIMSKEYLIAQPEQKENHIVIFINGQYYQREVVGFVLSTIFQSMKSYSKKLKHDFEEIKIKTKLLEAFDNMNPNYHCGCNRKHCSEIMQLFGDNGISPNKENNKLSYGDASQKITFVIKSHNTPIKHDSVQRLAKSPGKWYAILATHMKERTKGNIETLIKKPQQTDFDKKQIQKYVDDKTDKTDIIKTLKLKRIEQKDICVKCGEEMYFGNDNDTSEFINCGNKASPDRKDNDNVFYEPENFDLVCCSCNFTENRGGRTFVFNKCINKPIPFTLELLQKCKDFLKFTTFKRRKLK